MVLHAMQEIIEPSHPKRVIFEGLTKLVTDIPTLVILHDPPVFTSSGEPDKNMVETVRELVKKYPVVMNSDEAAKLWGFGTPIIHGCQEEVFVPGSFKVPRIISCVSRPCEYEIKVTEALRRLGVKVFRVRDDFKIQCFQDYLDILGSSLIFLHPYKESPMPRARTEAAYCSCAIAQVQGSHGSEYFTSAVALPEKEPIKAAEILLSLLKDPRETVKRGKQCREEALEKLSWRAYEEKWNEFLTTVL
jgi:glycosyltransferase involved in cell wall biosynthesis